MTSTSHPLQDHSVLTDQRTMAIVAPDAAINWLPLPRIDGPSIFSALLDDDRAGSWRIRPDTESTSSLPRQRYLSNSFSLESAWPDITVTDLLDGSGGRSFQRAGRTDLLRVIEGTGRALVEFAPRPDFGRSKTVIRAMQPVGGTEQVGGLVVEGTRDPLVLISPGVRWSIEEALAGPIARTIVTPTAFPGGRVELELRFGTRSMVPSRLSTQARQDLNARSWQSWSASLHLPTIARSACERSAVVLRGLTHGPTGAIVAAASSSLPETIGGVRNWDYRYCWPRDAAFAASALVRLGNTGIAMKFLDWLLAVVDRCQGPESLRPIYSVNGSELGPEAELSNLAGYRGSRPVRVSNAASLQVQLDVFGPIVDLVYQLSLAGAAISPDLWRLVEAMVLAVERRWREPDHGIWELRSHRLHHTHSKAMGWLALDRGARLAQEFLGSRRDSWESLREVIRAEILDRAYNPSLGCFTAAYDLAEPDAATLTLGLIGLIEPQDDRFMRTVDVVRSKLLFGDTLKRYVYDDGLPGVEGGFHLCTGWLIEALAHVGQISEAESLFESLCRTAGRTGIMTEQWCPEERTGLGNLAQAYSHGAVIHAACTLEAIKRGRVV